MSEKPVKQLLTDIEDFSRKTQLSKREIADKLNIPFNTFRKWFQKGTVLHKPSSKYVKIINDFLYNQRIKRKIEKIKYLLLLLEDELRLFRDGSKESRDIFREELDPSDIGYISSLLVMLGDEDGFKRWCIFTTNKFNFFRSKER
ncbi:hypothetical protein KAU45_09935 [bacterium]|nr:hypothetical protein [bacterium]